MLAETNAWVGQGIFKQIPQRLKKHYETRRQDIRIDLGLGYFAYTPEEAARAWPELRKYERLFVEIEKWFKAGQIRTPFLPQYYARLIELRSRMGEYHGASESETDAERLDEVNFLLSVIAYIQNRGGFTSQQAKTKVTSPLTTERDRLEKLLKQQATKKAQPKIEEPITAPRVELASTPAPVIETAAPPPSTPRPPLREWLWRSILSERTLQALLFLGIFLLFVAAISFVVWGWKDFSAPVRVAIPFGFTALFFGLGTVVRSRSGLYRSGIALSAIAALLIPIDSYTIYANYGHPPQGWPEFWLITSLACFVAYILAALQIQSRFFGYITGIAAGSLVLASLEYFTDISRDWYSAAISGLAVVMILLGTWITRLPHAGRWRVFSEPFRYLALWIPAAAMPLTLGLRLITRDTYDSLHYAMTVNWFLGGFIFAWGAIYHRSRSLGILAAIALPISVYMGQGALFFRADINPAWHAFGLALLTPLYLYTGYRLSGFKADFILLAHGQTATRWGTALIIVAALLSLTDLTSGTAAAASHGILIVSTILIALLWERPRALFATSLFAFTASTFAMSELNLSLNQLGVGWSSLAIILILLTLRLARKPELVEKRKPYLIPLVTSAYIIAALAILPPLFLYNGQLLAYSLGNWITLSAWGAYLAHRAQPGFLPLPLSEMAKPNIFQRFFRFFTTEAIYHWFTTVPLPFWVWIVTRNNEWRDEVLPLLLVALAYLMVFISYWLKKTNSEECRYPWRLIGIIVSLVALFVAFINVPNGYVPSICVLAIGLLYFADTIASRDNVEFFPAGLVTAWGLWLVLTKAEVDKEVITFALTLLVAIYFLAGLEAERRRLTLGNYKFLAPLYTTAHILAIIILIRIYLNPLNDFFGNVDWTDTDQLWGAADQLLLGVVYGLYAWGRYQEFWGHIAAWLGMIGGGFIAIIYSQGHGSLAAKGALIAAIMVLAERGLNYLRQQKSLPNRRRAMVRLAWELYKRPLLVAGWTASVGIIILSLVRNLILLGGGRIQQIWAAAGLFIIVALYALSARMFRKARFVWFAVVVVFAPWTILTNLGWFTSFKPELPDFAVSWAVLAWVLFLIALWLERHAPQAYVTPLKTATHILLPFSMLWAVANTKDSLFTVGLSIALYATSAWINHRQSKQLERIITPLAGTKFFYPALGLLPLWAVYWLDYLLKSARHEHFGILILVFGVLGLAAGIGLERIAPRIEFKRAYGLPAYLTAYISIIVGTMLVAHLPRYLALALLYDALLMLASARIFKSHLWLYPASALPAISLLIALHEANIPAERQGWWLVGLAVMYLLLAWVFRRLRMDAYASVFIIMGFALTALSLPPSSLDRTGALWGYGAAALVYAVSAFWLKQPLLLTPASALIVVPYGALLQQSSIANDYYGLCLFPGALVAIALGYLLDHRFGEWKDFAWNRPSHWLSDLTKRFLEWWALPLYILGLGLASAAPFFADSRSGLIALNFVLLASLYGWAVYRFRLRFWLVTALLSAHYGLGFYLDTFKLWQNPDEAWLRFLLLTVAMLMAGLYIEREWKEGSPLSAKRFFYGWSRPFYLFVLFDILLSQGGSLSGTYAGMSVSIINMLMIAVLASIWLSPALTYISAFLGFWAVVQLHDAAHWSITNLPIEYAALAFGYGLIGFGYRLLIRWQSSGEKETESSPVTWDSVWEVPLQRSSMILSILSLLTGFLVRLRSRELERARVVRVVIPTNY
ncbi:MAG: hypothetical protein QM730_27250 [Anaerolineales bacterium]